jgi:lysozyme
LSLNDRARGIDIAYAQPKVDWPVVQTFGLTFALIKASEGTGIVDSHFKSHWAGAKSIGLLRGAYHFFLPYQDGAAQAENFLKQVKDDPGELPPVLDIEMTPQENKSGQPVDNDTRLRGAEIWLKIVESHLRRPIIYTGYSAWKDLMRSSAGQYPEWKEHALWMAYPVLATPPADDDPGKKPLIPPGWDTWQIWQYAWVGRVPGITSKTDQPVDVDLDVFNGTPEAMAAWAQDGLHHGEHDDDDQPVVPHILHQDLINVFAQAFGKQAYWEVVDRAGLAYIARGTEVRQQWYAGLPIEELPNLSDGEKNVIKSTVDQFLANL